MEHPEATQRARRWPDLAALALCLAVPLLAAALGARGPACVTLKLGPNTGAYLEGFAPNYEIEGLTATRWTRHQARVTLPLEVSGATEVALRYARIFGQTATVDVGLAGRPAGRFSCRGGTYRTQRFELGDLPASPAAISLDIAANEGRDRGLRLDWLRVGVGRGGRIALRGWVLWLPALLAAALWASLRWLGHGNPAALLLTAPWIVTAAVWPRLDPLGFAHVVRYVGPLALLAVLAATAGLRRVAGGRWLLPVFALSLLFKGLIVFLPTSYYPDFQNARRFVDELREGTGSLALRTVEAQKRINVAYPRIIAGRPYAFPYSPLPFLAFTPLEDADDIESAVRLAGLLVAALEVLLVFFLARALASGAGDAADPPGEQAARATRLALVAALLASTLPAPLSRLLLAMTVTLAGHLLDGLLVLATLLYLRRPDRPWRLAAVALAALASLLTYVSSLFTVSAFLAMVALVERRQAARLLAVLAGAVSITVAWLYWPFLLLFCREIVPALLQGQTLPAAQGSAAGGPLEALARIPLFFGYALPLLAVAGLVLARQRVEPRAFRVLVAYGLAFLLLVALRAFGRGLFRDLKEISFAGPLLTILAAFVVERLASLGRAGRTAALLVVLGLAAFGLGRSAEFLALYESPFLRVVD